METTNAATENSLQPKARLTGKVIKTTIAGAILDIGQKVPGVVHISQISKEPINKVEDALKIGQSVDVWVRRVRDDRIELTMVEPLCATGLGGSIISGPISADDHPANHRGEKCHRQDRPAPWKASVRGLRRQGGGDHKRRGG